MFNVTILKLNDLIKYFVGIIILLIIIFLAKYFLYSGKKISNNKVNINFSKCLNAEMPTIKTSTDKTEGALLNSTERGTKIENFLKETIETEISSLDFIQNGSNTNKMWSIYGINIANNDEDKTNQNSSSQNIEVTNNESGSNTNLNAQNNSNGSQNSDFQNTNNSDSKNVNNNGTQNVNSSNPENIKLVDSSQNITTQIITPNPIAENYNSQYDKVKIRNQTSYQLTGDMLKPDVTIDNKNILIFHTHSCESYTPSPNYQYTQTGNYRSTDLNYSVVRVGTELENYLKAYKINVVHNTSYHDYPSYNGSYTRSLETVQSCLKITPSDIIIDLHRDAVGSKPDYAPTVKIGSDNCARIMFVIGTNDGGLWHPNWNQNLKFAIKLQEKAEEMYPGLFMPILLTKSRYNQHTGKFANIMEVGATGNTLEQCLNSMKYLSSVFNAILK